MPKVHIQTAAKDYHNEGIQKGDTYYKWKFRFGPVRRSKFRPTRSQLTQSEFLGTIYSIEDERIGNIGNVEAGNLLQERDEIVGELEELRDEQEAKLQNMPESLQYGPTGEMLQERYDMLDDMVSRLDTIDVPDEVEEPGDFQFDEEEPDESDFDSEDAFEEAHDKWQERYDSAESEHDDLVAEFEEFEQGIENAREEISMITYEGP